MEPPPLQVEFPLEEDWPCVSVPRALLPRIGVLSDVTPDTPSVEMRLPGVDARTLSALCDLLHSGGAVDGHDLEALCALTRVHARLEVDPALGPLEHAVGRALGDLGTERLQAVAMQGDPAEWPRADETWYLSAEQRQVKEPLQCLRMRLQFGALQALFPGDTRLAVACMTRVPLPFTALEQLARTLDLSTYMTRVVHELLLRRDDLSRLLWIACSKAAEITIINGAAYVGTEREHLSDSRLLKVLLRQADQELARRVKRGHMSRLEKDATMVRQFLGWGVTRAGHVIYLYYRGPSSRSPGDMARLENWRPLPLDALRYFHARLGKQDVATLQRKLCSSDVVMHTDGSHNPSLDVRFLAHRWVKRNPSKVTVIRENEGLFR